MKGERRKKKKREKREITGKKKERKKADSWRIDNGNCLSVDPTLSIDNTLSPTGQALSSLQATFESSNMTNPEGQQDCQLDWVKMAEIFVLQTANHNVTIVKMTRIIVKQLTANISNDVRRPYVDKNHSYIHA